MSLPILTKDEIDGICAHACTLGTPEVAAQSLSTLIEAAKAPDAEFEVAAVVTQVNGHD